MPQKSSKIIEPIFQEWWEKGSIVAASEQHKRDVRQAFYVGWFAAMGMVGRVQLNDTEIAQAMLKQMMHECKEVIYDKQIKFTASIDGKLINN